MSLLMLVLLVIIIIPVFITLMFTPYLTRKTESFGVSIPEEIYDSPELKAMRKQYVINSGILSAIVMALILVSSILFGNDENVISVLFSILIALYLFFSFLIYLKFHQKMKKRKEKENWTKEKSQQVYVDFSFRKQKLTYSNLWFIFSFILSFATIVLTFVFYERIPNQIPIQYNFEGDIVNWTEKSYRSVLIFPIMQLYLTLLFLFINTMISRAKQQINSANPEESKKQNIIFRRRWSLYLIVSGTALVVMFSFIQFSFIFPVNETLILVFPLGLSLFMILGAIILSITTGQGGSRVKIGKDINGSVIDRDDDRYWKFGQFYFNPDDPALFLEKRFGIGWTFNTARPLAWIIFVAVIGLAIGIPLLLTM